MARSVILFGEGTGLEDNRDKIGGISDWGWKEKKRKTEREKLEAKCMNEGKKNDRKENVGKEYKISEVA